MPLILSGIFNLKGQDEKFTPMDIFKEAQAT